MENIGKYIMLGGVVLIAAGGLVFLAGKLGLSLGRLPGDIHIQGKNGSFYFPITTCILASLVLTGLLALARWLLKK